MQDLTGQVFGRWTVVRRDGSANREATWLCECTCGSERVLRGTVLRHGKSKSCGCLKREVTIKRSTKHGHATGGVISRTYHTWAGMIARCTNPRQKHYRYYGGRGIGVDPRWTDFANFLADMGERPPNTTIERLDGDGDYTKENCVWATTVVQARNKTTNHILTLGDESKTIAEWSETLGIHPATLSDRLQHGWSDEKTLTTPAGTPTNNIRTRSLTVDGRTLSVAEWCRRLGLNSATVYMRLHRGWPAHRALGLTLS